MPTYKGKELDFYLISYTQIYSKWIIGLNVRTEFMINKE